jgi:hypothetical protein
MVDLNLLVAFSSPTVAGLELDDDVVFTCDATSYTCDGASVRRREKNWHVQR